MSFIESLSVAPRLVVDPGHLREGIAALSSAYPEVTVMVLRPDIAGEAHTLTHHSRPNADLPGVGATVPLPAELVDRRLGEDGYALMHAPFPGESGLGTLLPEAESLFLRRAFTEQGETLLLVFASPGINADYASRQGPYLLSERLRDRFDEQLMQARVQHATRQLEQAIDEVKRVKEKLLPSPDHRVQGMRYAVHYDPCTGGGGDYFEVSDLAHARDRILGASEGNFWGVIIADVSGHGPGAAVEVAMIDSILRTYTGTREHHPGMVLSYCNRHMFTRQLRGGFATAFICNYDGDTRTMQYACAGHPVPMVKCTGSGRICRILDGATDIPLGVITDYQWPSASTELAPGDMVVLYTDGATEAESPKGEPFGVNGMRQAVEASKAKTPKGLLADIVAALHKHVEPGYVADDCTILVVQPE